MKRIIGLDLGSRTCGIAISDSLGIIACGVENYRFKDSDYDNVLNYISDFCKKNDIAKIVLGLPKHMNGEIGDRAKNVIDFKEKLEALTKLEVVLIDERWTTIIANKRLLDADLSRKKRKEVIDKMAAVVILQNYLDR